MNSVYYVFFIGMIISYGFGVFFLSLEKKTISLESHSGYYDDEIL